MYNREFSRSRIRTPHLSLQKRVLKLCYCTGQPAIACRYRLHAEAVNRDGRARENLQVARDGPVAQQQQAPQRVLAGEGRCRQQRVHLTAIPNDVDEAAERIIGGRWGSACKI